MRRRGTACCALCSCPNPYGSPELGRGGLRHAISVTLWRTSARRRGAGMRGAGSKTIGLFQAAVKDPAQRPGLSKSASTDGSVGDSSGAAAA